MRPRAPMRLLITGALLIFSSRRIAILRPMLSPVMRSEIAAPWWSNSNDTSGRPVFWSQVWSAFDRYSPVSAARLCR